MCKPSKDNTPPGAASPERLRPRDRIESLVRSGLHDEAVAVLEAQLRRSPHSALGYRPPAPEAIAAGPPSASLRAVQQRLPNLVFPLIPEPNRLRVISDKTASSKDGGSREEEAFHGRADRLRPGASRRSACGVLFTEA